MRIKYPSKLLILLALSCSSLIAQQVTLTLGGVLNQIYTQPGGVSTTSSTFQLGRPFSLTLSYDASTAPGGPGVPVSGIPNLQRYLTGSAVFNYDGGAYVGSSSAVGIEIYNDSGSGDLFRIFQFSPTSGFGDVDGLPFDTISTYFFQLHYPSETAFSSASLPTSLPSSAFDGYLALRYGSGVRNIGFNVTSVSSVPEPSTYAALSGALIFAAAALSKLRKRKSGPHAF